MEEQMRALEKKLEDQAQTMHTLMQMVKDLKDSSSSSPRSDNSSHQYNFSRASGMIPKLGFPKFDGSNPRAWIKKCSRYFYLCKIPDDSRVDLVALHMVDKAEAWVTSYLAARRCVGGDDFILDLTARFKDDKSINVVELFNKLT
ncbi:Protein PSP1 [Bienertia sinuspersici]